MESVFTLIKQLYEEKIPIHENIYHQAHFGKAMRAQAQKFFLEHCLAVILASFSQKVTKLGQAQPQPAVL